MATMIRIEYMDGTSETVRPTMRAMCMAEEHAIKEKWGSVNDSPIRVNLYMAYAALRLSGKLSEPFDAWLDRVASTDVTEEEADETNPTA